MANRLPMKITLYAQVNDSEVFNQIAVIEEDVTFELIEDPDRRPGEAVEAVGRIKDFDIVAALRTAADRIEAERG
jgi:hypothetical protein